MLEFLGTQSIWANDSIPLAWECRAASGGLQFAVAAGYVPVAFWEVDRVYCDVVCGASSIISGTQHIVGP